MGLYSQKHQYLKNQSLHQIQFAKRQKQSLSIEKNHFGSNIHLKDLNPIRMNQKNNTLKNNHYSSQTIGISWSAKKEFYQSQIFSGSISTSKLPYKQKKMTLVFPNILH